MRPASPWRLLPGIAQGLWWSRAMTLGVRVVALEGREVFLVRHTYRPGWYLPGGGVDRGEAVEAAAHRELAEEGGLRIEGRLALHGIFRHGRRDHVVCYVARDLLRPPEPFRPNWEIAEARFFALDALPEETTRATRARLAEITQGRPIPVDW